MMKNTSLLVFDLDGTLIDSEMDIAQAVNWAMVKHGLEPLPFELIKKYVGRGVQPLFKNTFEALGLSSADEAIEDFKKFYSENLVVHTTLFPGTLDVLEAYRDWEKIILTNKTVDFVEPILNDLKIQKYFKKFYGRNSFSTQKPDPGPLLEIAKEFQIPSNKIIMIGDTEADILAGNRAKTKTCAVFFGYGERQVLLDLKPTFTVESPLELVGLFD